MNDAETYVMSLGNCLDCSNILGTWFSWIMGKVVWPRKGSVLKHTQMAASQNNVARLSSSVCSQDYGAGCKWVILCTELEG